jgi:hypothetical protein
MDPIRRILKLNKPRPDEESDILFFVVTWIMAFVVCITLMQTLLALGGDVSTFRDSGGTAPTHYQSW